MGHSDSSTATDWMASEPVNGSWLRADVFAVGGTEFLVSYDPERFAHEESDARRLVVAKSRSMVARLAAEVATLRPQRIVDLGIYKGGSAALLAALARPVKLTAVELEDEPVAALEDFVAEHRLESVIAAHYGLDQGDGPQLAAAIERDHGNESLDLVVDDASHQYRSSRTSFEVLFGRLRSGGKYVIEDWAWAHFPEPRWQVAGGEFHDRPALTNLVVEILMIAGTGYGLISHVDVLHETVTVTRGPLRLDGALRLEDHYRNRQLPFRPLL
jgi:predicted O-methyltransferase YrrM